MKRLFFLLLCSCAKTKAPDTFTWQSATPREKLALDHFEQTHKIDRFFVFTGEDGHTVGVGPVRADGGEAVVTDGGVPALLHIDTGPMR